MTRFERALAFQHAPHPKCGEVDRAPPHPEIYTRILNDTKFSFYMQNIKYEVSINLTMDIVAPTRLEPVHPP